MESIISVNNRETQEAIQRKIQMLSNKQKKYSTMAEDSRYINATGDYARVDDYNFYLRQAEYLTKEIGRLERELMKLDNVYKNKNETVSISPVARTTLTKKSNTAYSSIAKRDIAKATGTIHTNQSAVSELSYRTYPNQKNVDRNSLSWIEILVIILLCITGYYVCA